jgi:hypothetical protein
MSVMEHRGGVPHVFAETVTTSGWKHDPKFVSKYLQVMTATNPVKIFFSQADFDAGVNFILVPVPALQDLVVWEGPVEAREVWFLGVGGSAAVTAVFYQRRG